MGHKRKKMPRRPHCKVAPKKIAPNKPKREVPDYDVMIEISKSHGENGFNGKIIARNTDVLVEALAVMVQEAAETIGTTSDRVYAIVATRLFKEEITGTPIPDGEG